MPSPDLTISLGAWLLLPLVLLTGFFLSGHLVFRSFGCTLPWVGAFIGSVLLLVFTVLFFNAVNIPIRFGTLACWLAAISLVGWWCAGKPKLSLPTLPRFTWSWRELWWCLPCATAFASVLGRALIDPLSGWDNVFRWNHLALLIRAQESLRAYPPFTAADFRVYPWCDGIPPTLSVTNLWIYLGTGSTYGGLIAGRNLVELILTYGLVWDLAGKLWGPRSARLAVAVLATSSLFMWSIAMSQETGLTGVALLAMAAFALEFQKSPGLNNAIWLMLAASLAAITREYNLVFLPGAVLMLILGKAPRSHLLTAIAVGALVVMPWYIRNAWITGNPLYAEPLGGLLHTNAYHREFTAAARDYWSLFAHPEYLFPLALDISAGGGIVLLLGIVGLSQDDCRLFTLRLLVGIAVLLWLFSISSTAAGWGYSLRVLGPALPLLAVCSGWLSLRLPSAFMTILGLVLVVFNIDAVRRSWFLPIDFRESVWPYSWQRWSHFSKTFKQLSYPDFWAILVGAAANEGIIVDHPMNVIHGGRFGGLMIPMSSPEAYPLTQPKGATDFATIQNTLRAQHIRFIVLSVDTPMNARLLKRWPAIQAIRETKPTIQIGGMLIYDLALVDDQKPTGP